MLLLAERILGLSFNDNKNKTTRGNSSAFLFLFAFCWPDTLLPDLFNLSLPPILGLINVRD